jgi:hypothetical protein
MNIREEMIKESYGYKGHYFWENYMLSNIVRTVSRDLKKYEDPNLVVEMYGLLYGDESIELFEDMVSNEEELHETAQIKGELLFEGINERVFSKFAPGLIGGGVGAGAGGFLRGLWTKFKGLFSKGNFATSGAVLKSGFDWAKNLVKQGVDWVANNPIASVAVPVLLVVGGLKAAKALINKIRRKTGKKKMSPEEEQQFDEIAAKNEGKVKKTRKKVLKAA